jgi:site-specific recombinase XerD
LKNLWHNGWFASGNAKWFYRYKAGGKVVRIALPDAPTDSAEFLAAYAKAREGHKPTKARRGPSGSIAAACEAYLASDWYLALAPSTRALWRREVDDISARYGRGSLGTLRAVHIRQDMASGGAHRANRRRKVWRSLGRYWLEVGLIEEDPSRAVTARRTAPTTGHKAWTAEDVAAFRAHWPTDTMQRRAFEVMHRTGAAIGDAIRLGRGHVSEGWLEYRRGKSGGVSLVPMRADLAPSWFPFDDCLEACLAHPPHHMIWLTTQDGSARSAKAAAQWFSAACRKAGVGKTAHGIRKYLAATMKERGATADQRMAILGHDTERMADHYSRSADLRKIIAGTQGDTGPKQGDTEGRKSEGKQGA